MTPMDATEKLLNEVESASPEEVQALLDAGADPNARDRDGKTALMLAVIYNYPEVVKVLLAAGANVHARDYKDMTALMWVACKGDYEMTQALLDGYV